MSLSAKNKIIIKSVRLFNEWGFGAVSMQELANQLSMTRGNLTYHFKDKEALLETIVERVWAKMEAERSKIRALPSFENLYNSTKILYQTQKEYSFLFLDRHVLQHSLVKNKFREMTQQAITDYKATIAFAMRLGNMKAEPFKGLYHNLAFITWMLSFYWLNQEFARGAEAHDFEEMIKKIWSILLPHFTEKGTQSFIKFFGQEYYNTLGAPFEIEDLIQF